MKFLVVIQAALIAIAQCSVFIVKDVDKNPGIRVINQDEEGPCPIIAINITLPPSIRTISSHWIETTVTSYLRAKAQAKHAESMQVHDSNELKIIEEKMITIYKTISLLPKLFESLGVDPVFTSNSAFTTGIAAVETYYFQAFDIPLKHAWVIDQSNDELTNAVLSYGFSYEQVTAALHGTYKGNTSKKWQQTANDWLMNSEGLQATEYGIQKLSTAANPGFNVLFKGAHFHVIFRNAADRIMILDTFKITGFSTAWKYLKI